MKKLVISLAKKAVMLLPDRFTDSKNKRGILFGIVVAVTGALAVIGLMWALSKVFYMPEAHASDLYNTVKTAPVAEFVLEKPKRVNYWFKEPPYITFGLAYEFRGTICSGEDAFKDNIISDIAIGQKVYKSTNWRHSVDVLYRHHSCAFAVDKATTDSVGIGYTYSLWN